VDFAGHSTQAMIDTLIVVQLKTRLEFSLTCPLVEPCVSYRRQPLLDKGLLHIVPWFTTETQT